MKKFIGYLTLMTLIFSNGIFGEIGDECPTVQEPAVEEPAVINIAEEPEAFNRGQFVGTESDMFAAQRRREITKNWGIAFGTVIIGVTALIFAKKN